MDNSSHAGRSATLFVRSQLRLAWSNPVTIERQDKDILTELARRLGPLSTLDRNALARIRERQKNDNEDINEAFSRLLASERSVEYVRGVVLGFAGIY